MNIHRILPILAALALLPATGADAGPREDSLVASAKRAAAAHPDPEVGRAVDALARAGFLPKLAAAWALGSAPGGDLGGLIAQKPPPTPGGTVEQRQAALAASRAGIRKARRIAQNYLRQAHAGGAFQYKRTTVTKTPFGPVWTCYFGGKKVRGEKRGFHAKVHTLPATGAAWEGDAKKPPGRPS